MIIASLKRKKADVVIIFDDGTFTSLDHRVVYDNGLRKFDEINDDKLAALKYKSGILQIKDSAFRFLARRLHSSQELKTKLIKKGFDKSFVNDVIQQLAEQKYLDDEQFAKLVVEEKTVKKRFGVNKVKAELLKKGIDREIIDYVLSDHNDELNEDNALYLAQKKIKLLREKTNDKRKLKEKLFSYLLGKGYTTDIIMKVINALNLDNPDTEVC